MFIIVFISCLVLMSCIDLLIKEIPVLLVVILAGLSIIRLFIRVGNNEISLASSLFVIVPGIIFILISYMFPQQIGLGDGLVMVFVLMGKDIYFCLITLFVSTISLLVVSIVIVFVNRRESKDIEIPFIPFITFGVIFSEFII